jgi:hypothetical protein
LSLQVKTLKARQHSYHKNCYKTLSNSKITAILYFIKQALETTGKLMKRLSLSIWIAAEMNDHFLFAAKVSIPRQSFFY